MAHLENYFESASFGSKRECEKCGRYIPRRQLVRDGYSMGLVCADCWDPPEPTIRATSEAEPQEPT